MATVLAVEDDDGADDGANVVVEAVEIEVEGDGEDEGESEELDYAEEYIVRVTKGWIEKASGKCLMNVKFKSGDFVDKAELSAVIQDDYKNKILRWIVLQKWGDVIWLKQAEEGMKMSKGGKYNTWKGWVDFVEGEVREKQMMEKTLEMVRSGGGSLRQRRAWPGKKWRRL